MHDSRRHRRVLRLIGLGILVGSVTLGSGQLAIATSAEPDVSSVEAPAEPASPTDSLPPAIYPAAQSSAQSEDEIEQTTAEDQVGAVAVTASSKGAPYGKAYPVTIETNFSRPIRSISSAKNSDFSLLDDLERLIRGSYLDPRTGKLRPQRQRRSNIVYISVSRMQYSYRVGRELVKAAKNGVQVRFIHGKASQSKESRKLVSQLKSVKYKGKHTGKVRICSKGRSLACLSRRYGAIMHSKILLVKSTFTRENRPAIGAMWSGSANLGGPSGEKTYNNGWTVYNDQKLWNQSMAFWSDMWAMRNIARNDYLGHIKKNSKRYGLARAKSKGYTASYARNGMFYSNLANVTYYMTPIAATPTNGKDPVMNLLNRIKPDDRCRIYLQQNRFKYRRIGVAQKLVELANRGCRIEAVAFRDDLLVNRIAHCQSWIRICDPILDEFRTANVHIPAAWAKPHDKTTLVDAVLKRNRLNPEERLPNGRVWPKAGSRVQVVQAGSAALTGSNLIVSDEVTTESTDPEVYAQYLEHYKSITKSYEYHEVKY